jgi:hypothetical protein
MATAERPAPADPKHYVWWFPGAPVKVHLSLDVVRRIKERVNPASREEGLLLGSTRDGITEIVDFQPAPNGIPELLEGPQRASKNNVAGYYRTETGNALQLTGADLALDASFFGHSRQVFLLLQPTAFGVPNAGFFFHDAAGQMSQFSFMEFPFDPAQLASEERGRISRSLQAAVRQPEPGPLPMAEAAPEAPPRSIPKPRRRHPVLSTFLLTILLLTAGAAAWIRFPLLRERIQSALRPAPSPAAPPPASPLYSGMELHANRQNGELLVTWNRESPLIQNAASGTMSIEDGQVRREILLDAVQLKSGSIVYSPLTDQIGLRLAVTADGKTAVESVVVVVPAGWEILAYPVAPPKATAAAATPPPRPFVAPQAPARDTAGSLEDPPLVRLNPATRPAASPPAALGQMVASPPRSSAENQQPAGQDPPVFQQAVPVRKVLPRAPAGFGASFPSSNVVEVRVSIDRTGRVTKAEPLPKRGVSSVFYAAAVAAATEWQFQPARRDNEPVISELVLQFVFKK